MCIKIKLSIQIKAIPFFFSKNYPSSILFQKNKYAPKHEIFSNFSTIARSGFFSKATEAKSSYELKTRRQQTPFMGAKIKNKGKLNNTFAVAPVEGEDISRIVSEYKTNKLNKVTLRTATKRLSCFARRGNHPRRHNMFSKYIINRAINTKRIKKLPLSFYLPTFFNAATPFVRLKTRRQRSRRRKKLFQKVSYRLRENGERQSYLLFAKRLQKSKKSIKTNLFREQIQTQRESLFVPKSRRKVKFDSLKTLKKSKSVQSTTSNETVKAQSTTALTGQSAVKNLRQIRDEIHKRAFRIKPRRWRSFKSKKEGLKSKKKNWKAAVAHNAQNLSYKKKLKIKKKLLPLFFQSNFKNRFKISSNNIANKRPIEAKKLNVFTKKLSKYATKLIQFGFILV